MDCDRASLATCIHAPSLTQPARACTPAERGREAAGAPRRRARSSRGELCGETSPRGAGRVSFLRDLGLKKETLLPPLVRPANNCGLSSFSSATPAAAAAVRGSSLSSPAPPSPPQHVESMATELENRCPICLDSWEEASYVMPCLHQFCYECILRWAESKPECPLCKRRVSSILHSVQEDDDFEEHVIPPPAAASVVVHLTGGAAGQPAAHSLHHSAAARPAAAGPLPWAPVGGFHAYVWASLFRVYPTVLRPLLPWLHRELGQLFEDAQEAAAAQSLVTSSLRYFGLDEGALIQLLQASLGRRTRSFVHQLIDTIVRLCSAEARRRMGLGDGHAAGRREGGPVAAPGPAASRGRSPAPSAALCGGPGSPPSAPVPTRGEQEEAQEDPEEAVPGPSTRSRGSERSPGGCRRAPKRRARSSKDPSQPPRKPPRHR
ncbi:hypothetical protein QYF61_018662 [Mycteria americana]|uniref:E3 ubiquitin-protein ligase Topors n=1 Tax=Mycteria americana TaxID=33587 RepID=A0AAN7MZE8_MYCAM|nr:hypothetical protein QYF61_018659 [Mycteria americana]KAK4816614.1 hypothetical protein QYF61_018662 [Mycteria americana]